MRYSDTETVNLVGRLPTGETVTIEVYEINTESPVALTTNTCSEIASTGLFRWPKTNMATQPTAYTEYVYTMIDSLNNRYDGKFVIVPPAAREMLIEKLLRNKRVTNPVTGVQTIYDDDGITKLVEGSLWEDVAGDTPYQGAGADRADRLDDTP